jgi:hypothetical protein
MAFGAILQGLATDETKDRLTIGDIVEAMGERAFGPLLVVFALPNILPTPPGTAGVMAIPLIFLTVQMILAQRPWLPGFLARRSISRQSFARFATRATGLLARVGRFLRPRLGLFVRPLPERLIGGFCLMLALVLLMPIPFANSTPAFAICLFGLGLLERDGVWILAGMIASVGAVLLALWLGSTLVQAALAFAEHILA